MGAGESKQDSKQDSSSSYGVNEGSKSELELPQELHQGPIHSLAVLDRQHLLSAGADKVTYAEYPRTHRSEIG